MSMLLEPSVGTIIVYLVPLIFFGWRRGGRSPELEFLHIPPSSKSQI